MDSQVIRYQIRSAAHDFSLAIEEHGGYNLGVENVVFRPSRPLNGQSVFISTNGRAFFAAEGKLLFLKDAALVVIVQLDDGRVFHMEPPTPWLLGLVSVQDDLIHADLYQYDNLELSDKIEPIPLNQLAQRLSDGWGKAADGLFPTANHNFVKLYKRHA
jgi:hypothetical protein